MVLKWNLNSCTLNKYFIVLTTFLKQNIRKPIDNVSFQFFYNTEPMFDPYIFSYTHLFWFFFAISQWYN